jgi:hypothetical protein
MLVCDWCKSTNSVIETRTGCFTQENTPVRDGLSRQFQLCVKCRVSLGETITGLAESRTSVNSQEANKSCLVYFTDREHLVALTGVVASLCKRHFNESFLFRVVNKDGDFVSYDARYNIPHPEDKTVTWIPAE